MTMKGIFHIHTKYSFDSILSPKRIVKSAIENNYDFIAITDHNTIRGAVEAYNYNKHSNCEDLKVIIGAEYATDKGEIIGLFVKEETNSRNSKKVLRSIREQGGIVVLPHPFKGHKLNDELMKSIDVIEVYNSRVDLVINQKAEGLAKRYNKPIIVGSDAHFYKEIGLTLMSFENAPSMDLKETILYGKRKIVRCNESKCYYEILSQLIKSYKTNDTKMLFSQGKKFFGAVRKDSECRIKELSHRLRKGDL